MFRKISVDIWVARGWVNTLIVPLIALSATRNPKWTVGIAVSGGASCLLFRIVRRGGLPVTDGRSRLFTFGSREAPGGRYSQLTFLFRAVILLIVVVLFSGTTHFWLRVFISKHFFSYNYDYREEWLRFTAPCRGRNRIEVRVIKSTRTAHRRILAGGGMVQIRNNIMPICRVPLEYCISTLPW
ncbi:MAG: hypothetical protein P0107_06995 [Nitrosomonas sp.]|nr:hypothetical protein [Nitrosomonas sp.]